MNPVLLVIAGPNGAGKTTVTKRLRAERWSEGVEYLNPDDIARDRFGDWNSPDAVRSAANWAHERRESLLVEGRGIAFETVFSTAEKVDFVERARALDYFIRLFFISTSDPRINAARVADRVMGGGHTVPIDKILSRYERSMANLWPAIHLADRTYVYDNSVDNVDARLCVRFVDGATRKIYGDLPTWIADVVDGAVGDSRTTPTWPRHPELVDLRRG